MEVEDEEEAMMPSLKDAHSTVPETSAQNSRTVYSNEAVLLYNK